MYQMILLVLDNIDQCNTILDAWETTGVGGITIFESTGLGRMRNSGIRDDIPLMPSLARLMQTREERHRTLFTVVEGEAMVDRIIAITEEILGSLEGPHNGVLFVLPVSRVVGLKGGQSRAAKGKDNS